MGRRENILTIQRPKKKRGNDFTGTTTRKMLENCARNVYIIVLPHKRRKALMHQYNVRSQFERIAIDITGPIPESDQSNK